MEFRVFFLAVLLLGVICPVWPEGMLDGRFSETGTIQGAAGPAFPKAMIDSHFSEAETVKGTAGPGLPSELAARHIPDAEVIKAVAGQSLWTFLHIVALQYPEAPSQQYRSTLESFFALLPIMYPCGDCSDNMRALFRDNPIRTESKREFGSWLCGIHNTVNRSLGKEEVKCEDWEALWETRLVPCDTYRLKK